MAVPFLALLASIGCAGNSSSRSSASPVLSAKSEPRVSSPARLAAPILRTGTALAADDPPPLATFAAASRLLDQAAFGPTATDVQHVQQIGIQGYLNEQYGTAPSVLAAIQPNPKISGQYKQNEEEVYLAYLTAPDQLRQRVAFALSEIFVVSDLGTDPQTIIPFHNMLAADAFGNFSTLLHDVTVSPAMGGYLNLLNSAAPTSGQIANENYARELMQLFTIGLAQLNPDGSEIDDSSGNPTPTYTAAQVQAFARAYTGWTYPNADGSTPTTFPNPTPNYKLPLVPVESAHDTGEKDLLNGTILPPGLSAEQDLDAAITNIFNQPNVGPFFCRQLIQHLVTGNPSPAYVARVAAVFNDDGNGVRGNLTAVLNAIFLDHKARAGDIGATLIDGHLREPILWLVSVIRGLGFTFSGPADYEELSVQGALMFELPYHSPSVFNFFPPDYVIPGIGVNAPEFASENTASAMVRITVADQIVHNLVGGLNIDLSASSPLGTLAAASPAALVDQLGAIFMHGQMPADMRQAIIDHVSTLSDPAQAARVATLLVITSPQYKDLH